jgi:predicted membrane protein
MARLVKFKKNNFVNLENVIGLLLAILIIFDLKLEEPLHNALNTTWGIIFSVVIVLILFVTVNPIIGILFIIYLYQNYSTKNYHEKKKDDILKKLNPPQVMQVEEEIILQRAPIINQNKNKIVSFIPMQE